MTIKKVLFIVLMLLFCLTLGIFAVRDYNAKALDMLLSSPEDIFNGTFNTSKNIDDPASIASGIDICVSFSNANIGFDEKHLYFGDILDEDKRTQENFNYYFIRYPYPDTLINKETGELETVWYLCKFDGVNSLILLNENNDEIGRISYNLDIQNWTGNRNLKYYWISEDNITPIFKRAETTYSAGVSYLKSKYLSEAFPE
ncbi:MAG: hypothetical protein ACI4LZ_09645 [Anaerovoracaceae bacterium]